LYFLIPLEIEDNVGLIQGCGAKKVLLWHKKVFLRQRERGENAKKLDNWIQLLQICNRSQQFKKE
jgi:hypothetical protein